MMLKALLYISDKHESYKERVQEAIADMNKVNKNIELNIFCNTNVEQYHDLKKLPTLILYKNNKELFRWEGVYTQSSLWWKLIKYLGEE
ncbi:MAG: hypothetical protein ACOC80_10685 [Petrotogales bacterium]